MGDIILTTPVLHWIKQRFANSCLDMLVRPQYVSLVENQPDVDEILTFSKESSLSQIYKNIRAREYDAVVDLQANPVSRWLTYRSGAKHIALYKPQRWDRFWLVYFGWDLYQNIQPIPLRYLQAVKQWGVLDNGQGPALYPKETDIYKIAMALSGLPTGNLAVLAPGAGRKTKRWPAEYFQKVGQYLQESGYQIVITGGSEDRPVCEKITLALQGKVCNLCGDLTFMETAALIQQSKIVISNDTGVMHMSGAVHTPVVAIFGPTTRHLGFFPFRCRSVVVEHPDLACRPCSFHGTSTCPKKHFRCMKDLTPAIVIDAVESLITESAGRRGISRNPESSVACL